jgi:N-acetylmuramoyl-L-alanine amidase
LVYKTKLIQILILTLLITCLFTTISVFAGSSDIKIQLDGEEITCDVAPVIVDDRTLVPFRAIFEAMGATVGWNQSTYEATVTYDSTVVTVKIGSTNATINGITKTLDVPSQIINDRTMIPVRFVSENLGFTVDWDNTARAVLLSSPVRQCTISKVTVSPGSGGSGSTTVTICAEDSLASAYKSMVLSSPDRYFVDLIGFTRAGTLKDTLTNSDTSSVVSSVRIAQNQDDIVRVVMDLKEASAPTIALSSDTRTLTLTFGAFSDGDTEEITTPPAYIFDPLADDKIVVCIDPGHGTTTAGKCSPDETLLEWEFNRDVAYMLKDHLEAHGIETVMTVSQEDKTDPALAERVAIANDSDADIFVSIHANAYGSEGEWTLPHGWEIYVFQTGDYAEELAKAIQSANIPENGLYDRGVKTENFYVLKNTLMPAVLIEHGFYTNETEIELLKSDSFRKDLAEYDARGICNFFDIDW